MKKIIITALFLLSISFTTSELSAQVPPPPPGGHGEGGNQPAGGGTPIGGGLGILLALGAAYGGKKLYTAFKQREELDA
ncbi:MAG: hypothetical protein M0Q90_15270 [Bacteroidales bacterium]|nr:hypothetical protein [Bacteroidales bacterium]